VLVVCALTAHAIAIETVVATSYFSLVESPGSDVAIAYPLHVLLFALAKAVITIMQFAMGGVIAGEVTVADEALR
jgi:hypothetical protein